MSTGKKWLLAVVVIAATLALLAGGLAVWAQTTKHYDGDCESDDLYSDRCYGGFKGLDVAAPVTANEVFTTALTTIDVTVAANGYACPGNTTFYLKQGGVTVGSWTFTTSGSTEEFEHSFDVALGGQYWFNIYGVGSVCGWIEWVDVYGVEGATPEPTPMPETGCINTNPELETSSGWTDIGSPSWLTETVTLDQGDGFYQTVELDPGAYTVHVTATLPEGLDYRPITVSLGITETAERVELWGVEYVNFSISEAGTYTLSVQSDYDGQVEIGWTCLMAVLCVNEDQYLNNDLRWDSIGEPEFLFYSGGSGVALEYMEGVRQQVTLSAGGYRLEVSATMPIAFPFDRTDLEMCLGAACADSHVLTDTNIVALFNVLTGGDYDLTLRNLSTSRVYTGTNVMTITYACLSPIDNSCMVVDPGMDDIKVASFGGEQGWLTVYDDLLAYPGGAMLGCDQSVEQWTYLEAGTYTMTLHAAADFSTANLYSQSAFPVSGTLTIRLGPEDDPYNDYSTFLVPIHYVETENLGDSSYNRVYTVTVTVEESGNYLLTFGNFACVEGTLTLTDGHIWLDYVCLGDQAAGVAGRGQCSTLIDASFQEYNAPHWEQSGAVTWEPGMIRLAASASIAQSVDVSETELVAYVVARAAPGAELAADLGGVTATWEISQALPSQFSIFTATLSGLTLPATYTLESNSGEIEIDFTCLYRPGEVPDGPWDDDDDDDNACIEPLEPDFSGSFWEDVAAILRLIWDWIVYGVCIIVLWLQKIWLALGNWIKEIAIDLGLDKFWAAFVAWIKNLWQGPYDALQLSAYILNLLLGLAGRLFDILFGGVTLAFVFFSSILVALQFLAALLGAFWAAIANPCSALSLPVPSPVVQGYLLVVQALNSIDTLGVIQGILIGAMGLGVLFWTISQFKTLTGGGE